MKTIVTLKIDVTKIDKARLFAGQKGTYLDAVVFLDTDADDYGQNGMITQRVSKEEREAGTRGAILGNAKIIGGGAPAAAEAPTTAPEPQTPHLGDIPF
jgi:hypothetical protein